MMFLNLHCQNNRNDAEHEHHIFFKIMSKFLYEKFRRNYRISTSNLTRFLKHEES